MNETRKKIIVNEIVNWKKNRLLPEQYCDYLLALYTEGNQQEEMEGSGKNKNFFWENHYLFLLLIPLSVFLIHFTELSIILQMTFSLLFVFTAILFTFYFFRKGILLQIPLFVAALIILLASVEFFSSVYPDSPLLLYFNLIINCIIWMITGWKLKLPSFSISGILGFILIVIFIFK
ncbi:hypothetical protein [Cytobacillus dafuensis]|uniref:Uncharacterized protein n=1 Tax=Cytobacillus dafuensis TaxID=1742359 RepID=A0A5B8ZAM6_CYTDA|nr:hypothetical protein [Cytobacillus dafuensis]QED48669.1 hypothetical protein FSZ17_16210 [Cytobacillus dafuensis]